jgi:ABC-type lipoprotein export system ATPase subunit
MSERTNTAVIDQVGADQADVDSGALVKMTRVSKVYGSGGQAFTALQPLDLQIKAGTFVAIVGKSGSGKSTLLNLLAGFDRARRR